MPILVIRHGLSEANNRENYGKPAFGNPDAPLMSIGKDQARELGRRLVKDFKVDPDSEPVAVSMMRRTHETAIAAGFRMLHLYSELNEEKGDMTDAQTKVALETKSPPEATRLVARKLIEQPPTELVWVTHALLIATICQELGIYQTERFAPKFCEVRELPL